MIKRLTDDHISDLLTIQEQSYPEDLWSSPESVRSSFAWPICHGYFVNDKLAGVVSGYVENDHLHIFSVEVSPHYRNNSVGSKLVKFCQEFARSQHLTKVQAYAVTGLGKKLCESAGFVFSGQQIQIDNYQVDLMLWSDQSL